MKRFQWLSRARSPYGAFSKFTACLLSVGVLSVVASLLVGQQSAVAASYTQPWGTPGAAGQAVTVGTTSQQILPPQSNRKTLSVCNESTSAQIAIAFGATAAALNSAGSYTIPSGGCADWSFTFVPPDAVNVIASAAGTPVTFEAM
jgi:hypothetical protein